MNNPTQSRFHQVMNADSDTELYKQLPAFAGVDADAAHRIGASVEQCAEWLARMAVVLRELSRIANARLSSEPVLELKVMYSRMAHESILNAAALERRLDELRSQAHRIQHTLDFHLGDALREAMFSPGTIGLATAFFRVVVPDLLQAIETYLAATNPLADYESVRLLKHARLDLQEHRGFGDEAMVVLLTSLANTKASTDWEHHLRQYLSRAGGILGDQPIPQHIKLPQPIAEEDYRVGADFARDARFSPIVPKVVPPAPEGASPVHAELYEMMWRRSQETTAAELCATVAYEWDDDDLGNDFLIDMTRHGWDEARHGMFGRAALQTEGKQIWEVPAWIGYARHTMPAPPPKRYAHLAVATEMPAMKHPGGKRGQWEFCRDQAQHPLMTTFQDFDWADEVNHVHFGRRWLIQHYFKGDRRKALELGDETVRDRQAFYTQYAAEHPETDSL